MSEDVPAGWVPLGVGGGSSVSWEQNLETGEWSTVYRTYYANGEVASEQWDDDE